MPIGGRINIQQLDDRELKGLKTLGKVLYFLSGSVLLGAAISHGLGEYVNYINQLEGKGISQLANQLIENSTPYEALGIGGIISTFLYCPNKFNTHRIEIKKQPSDLEVEVKN